MVSDFRIRTVGIVIDINTTMGNCRVRRQRPCMAGSSPCDASLLHHTLPEASLQVQEGALFVTTPLSLSTYGSRLVVSPFPLHLRFDNAGFFPPHPHHHARHSPPPHHLTVTMWGADLDYSCGPARRCSSQRAKHRAQWNVWCRHGSSTCAAPFQLHLRLAYLQHAAHGDECFPRPVNVALLACALLHA